MSANSFISKYATRNNKKAIVQYYKIAATTKWVEYMLDKHEINKILMDSNFTTKMDLLEILQVLERKIDYMYKHPNFDFKKATSLFQILKTAPKVVTVETQNVAKKQHKK
jgi:hypothetical protein